jgi:hypothetical protein
MGLYSAGALSFLLFLVPARASALGYTDIPPQCGSRQELERQLEQRLGPTVDLSPTQVAITPAASGGYWLTVRVARQERRIWDADCAELFKAGIVVAMAMLVPAPDRAGRPQQRKAPPPARPELRSAFGTGPSIGLTPKPVLTLELGVQAVWRRWSVSLKGHSVAASTRFDPSRRGVTVTGVGGVALAGYRPLPELDLQLGFSAFSMTGSGRGATELSEDSAWTLGPAADAQLQLVRWAPVWAGLGLQAQLNLVRSRFEILDYGQVFRVAPVAAWGGARFGLFW